jgi:hypothetical protein
METAMLWRASDIVGRRIAARDGEVGKLDDFLFEDECWIVRWMVVDTGGWLTGRQVLLPPSCLDARVEGEGAFRVALSREEVERSPDLADDAPVTRHDELRIYDHYGWEPYWHLGAWGGYPGPYGIGAATQIPERRPDDMPPEIAHELAARTEESDPHLHSIEDTLGYHIAATDGAIGHVKDFVLDGAEWAIRYAIVDTGNWLPGRKVLIAPEWLSEIDWPDRRLHCRLTRRDIEQSPLYDPEKPLERTFEDRLHRHYGEEGYWRRAAAQATAGEIERG